MPERLPLRRRLLYAAIMVVLAVTISIASLLAVDVYLHHKYESVSAFNVWGYRGPAIPVKQPGETRIVVLGGSAAFGYGVPWKESFPYLLEARLNAAGRSGYRVVNLAFNNESAASFAPTLEDYRFLQYDAVILYEGYNDLLARPLTTSFRRQSMVFGSTGYLPILPMIAREKYFDWRYRGDIARGYSRNEAPQVAFRPQGGASIAASLASQVGTLTPGANVTPAGCDRQWSSYCRTVIDAVNAARQMEVLVLVASQPYLSDLHVGQQAAMREALARRFKDDPHVSYLDLGRAIDLKNQSLAFDGMHLTAAGNQTVADAFVQPLLELIETAKQGHR